ncbi:MAG: ribosomal-processing cysteine protease Prp, partial [Oscillospiraceae bacterium]|nr:ribosomal-processing cysteine protease Prp [Oscillospiraceae bacterium]
MITAEFLTHSGRFWGIDLCGHAEYDESGKDIVCAAVSAAAIMAANTV